MTTAPAIAFRALPGSVVAIWMNAVLQLWANAWANVSCEKVSRSKFVNTFPPAFTSGGQVVASARDIPWSTRAAAVTILKVEPGGYCPDRARSAPSTGALTTALMSPDPTSRATRAAGLLTATSAAWAARWVATSRVVLTGLGDAPGNRMRVRSTVDPRTTSTDPDGRPASCRSKARSNP